MKAPKATCSRNFILFCCSSPQASTEQLLFRQENPLHGQQDGENNTFLGRWHINFMNKVSRPDRVCKSPWRMLRRRARYPKRWDWWVSWLSGPQDTSSRSSRGACLMVWFLETAWSSLVYCWTSWLNRMRSLLLSQVNGISWDTKQSALRSPASRCIASLGHSDDMHCSEIRVVVFCSM